VTSGYASGDLETQLITQRSQVQILPAQRAKWQVTHGFGGSPERGVAKFLPNFCPSAAEMGSPGGCSLMIPISMGLADTCLQSLRLLFHLVARWRQEEAPRGQ